ncbi:hypothetical protein IFM89_004942 [Coptis chinensis]|uniref:Uncharacterized protein n=1 Tax=Coptis chinensis TaxID=261450 RepID=A0A835HSW9_9MAGN|nr:hypothetical protein IFM89_004942 [Coptis chinensis]
MRHNRTTIRGKTLVQIQQNFAPSPAAPGDGRNYVAQQNYPPQQNFSSTPAGPRDGRGTGAGRGDNMPLENRDLRGDSRNFGAAAGYYRQAAASSYSQSYPGLGKGQRFSQME